jgi:anti-repressor protein
MSTEILPFANGTWNIRALRDEQGDPWFVAKDVCDALGIRSDTVRLILDPDDISNINPNSIGVAGGRSPLIISEPGLYGLVMKSRKPEAKAFQRWVTHDVLPTIRKKGQYVDPAKITRVQLAQMVLEAEHELEITRPKADAWDDMASANGARSVADAAKALSTSGKKIGRTRLFLVLQQIHWIYRDQGDHRWRAYQAAIDTGYLTQKFNPPRTDLITGEQTNVPPTVRITHKGLMRLQEHLGIERPLLEVAA